MTQYMLTVRFYITEKVATYTYGTMTERALAMISLSPYADVIRTWEASC